MSKPLGITEVVLRDGHQSILATRLRLEDMLPIASTLDEVGYWSIESWGGATFDSCIRYLGEDPWARIRALKKAMPKTKQQMLFRGQNILGYRHYADDVVEKFVERAHVNGVDVSGADADANAADIDAEIIDGIVTLEKYHQLLLDEFVSLGSIRGFKPWPYIGAIQQREMTLMEASNMNQLIRQLIKGRVQGVYININVAIDYAANNFDGIQLYWNNSLPWCSAGSFISLKLATVKIATSTSFSASIVDGMNPLVGSLAASS